MASQNVNHKSESCIVCYEQYIFNLSIHFNLCCADLCEQCTKSWIYTNKANFWINPKCPKCSRGISDLKNVLTEKEKQGFFENSITLTVSLKNGERWLICPHCNYKEIGDDNDMFILCKNENCEKLSCTICYKSIPYATGTFPSHKTLKSNKTALQSALTRGVNQISMDEHQKCIDYGEMILRIEKVIQNSATRQCPNCSYRGRSDQGCTHTTCPQCNSTWCYVCLQEVGRHHNRIPDGGSVDTKICPYALESIYKIRESWPSDPQCALDKFHIHVTLRELNAIYLSLEENERDITFEILIEDFPHLFQGFTLDDIVNFTGYIFKDGDNIQYY